MQIDKKQLQRQKEGLARWKLNNYIGLLQWATGTGKTFAAILAIKHYRKHIKTDASVIVVVPSTNLYKQWKNRLVEHSVDNVQVYIINTLITNKHQCDLLILDEIHSYTGGLTFRQVFDCVSRTSILGLTASKREKYEDEVLLEKHCPTVDILPLREALNLGFISNYNVYNLVIDGGKPLNAQYRKLTKKFNRIFSTFDHDWELANRAIKSKEIRQSIADRKDYDVKIVDAHAFNFYKIMGERKTFLYEHPAILDTAIKLSNRYNNKKIITFSQTTKVADRITENVADSASCHSNLPTIKVDGKKMAAGRQIERNLKLFKENKLRQLNTAMSFNEGVDIPDIDMSIKCAYTSSKIDALQRLGRTLRKNEDHIATEINICLGGTQSEKWLRNSQKNIPNVHWISSIDEINVY